MKKLVIINLLLILLFYILPQKEIFVEKEAIIQEQQKISSRSLEYNREITIEQTTIENKPFSISSNGIYLIKKYEGLKLHSYRLEGETNFTIGYGHNGSDVKEGQTITEEQAETLLLADLQRYVDIVLKKCDYLDLTQNELDALVSFTYNVGQGSLNKLLANGTRSKEEIAEHITAYTKSSSEKNRNGLLKRRLEEKEMFLNGKNKKTK